MFQESLNDQLLSKFVKQASPGEFLFKQGEKGNAMYLILSGEVNLIHRGTKAEYIVELLKPGQGLGENVLFAPQSQRSYSAVAKTSVTVLELGPIEFKQISVKMPDFNSKLVRILSERLEACHAVINVLQSNQPIEKVILFLVFLAKQNEKNPKAVFEPGEVSECLNVPVEKVKEVITELENQKVLSKLKEGGFIIDVPESLLDQLTELKQLIAA